MVMTVQAPMTRTSAAASDRSGIIRKAAAAYAGATPDTIRRRPGEVDDNVKISLSRSIVDTGVAFLFGEEVTSTLTAKGATREQDWLDECWRRNKRMLTLQKLAHNGAVAGHTFVKLVPEGIRTRAGAPNWPRVVVLDPGQMAVVTDDDDCDTVLQYIYTYPLPDGADATTGAGQRREVVELSDTGEAWAIAEQHNAGGGVWITDSATLWPYDFAPVVDAQNLPKPNDFWGESDLPDDVQGLTQAINRVASNENKIIRVHAHPKVWARGMGTRVIDVSIDAVIQLPSETAELKSLEMQSDLSSTAAFLSELKENLAIITRTPLVALGVSDKQGALSGVALQIRFRPLVQKTLAKRLTYGDLLSEIDRRLLALGGLGEDHVTQLDWPELLPEDPLAERQVMVLDDSIGIASKETLSVKAGYDWEIEQANLKAEAAAAVALPVLTEPPTGGAVPPGSVPPPAALVAPLPDIAKKATSR